MRLSIAGRSDAKDGADGDASIWARRLSPFVPKLVTCLREGACRRHFLHDALAGVTVGLIALPLALAFAIASHVPPVAGLYTAIIAGFLISALGGSRVQVGGPTGAFVVIVAGVVDQHGYEGLALAALLAGLIVILLGALRFGSLIKFIPYPVTTGFTAGIAVIIFSSQMKDVFGLQIDGKLPGEFIHQWGAYWTAVRAHGINPAALGIALGGLAVMIVIRRFIPRVSGAIMAVALATIIVAACGLDSPDCAYRVETIGSRFGTPECPSGIPSGLPTLHLPTFSHETLDKLRDLFPVALTIAILASIESLLSAVVADGMTGGRHKSNCELVAQGAANIASILFGGIPATGAIARTAANVRCGAKTPVAGMIHAATLLMFMLLLAPFAARIPLAAFGSILLLVAWNMSERDHLRAIFRAPRSDLAVLLTTFGLTVFVDLTAAVGVGLVLACVLFMRRMTEVTNMSSLRETLREEAAEELGELSDPNSLDLRSVPDEAEVYEINGPLFFGAADLLKDVLGELKRPPKVFVLRLRRVSAIDATGLHALEEFHHKCHRHGVRLVLAGVHAQPIFAMTKFGLLDTVGMENVFGNIDDALNAARAHLGLPIVPRPQQAVAEVARERPREENLRVA